MGGDSSSASTWEGFGDPPAWWEEAEKRKERERLREHEQNPEMTEAAKKITFKLEDIKKRYQLPTSRLGGKSFPSGIQLGVRPYVSKKGKTEVLQFYQSTHGGRKEEISPPHGWDLSRGKKQVYRML